MEEYMAEPFNKSKPAGEGVPNPIGPEAFARSAADAVQAYLATPLQQQAGWQEKLNAPFQKLLVKSKPTEAEIRAAQKAYRTAFSQVAKACKSGTSVTY
jgi:hypothetical protein